MNIKIAWLVGICIFLNQRCASDDTSIIVVDTPTEPLPEVPTGEQPDSVAFDSLTIIYMNDIHGKIDNFGKVKHVIDHIKKNTNTLVLCAGDIFSGNPVIDQYADKGYPIVDLMNDIGVDVAVLGNHEFDYGLDVLAERYQQCKFDWICANVNANGSVLPQPSAYVVKELNGLKVVVTGFVETNGKQDDIIPATHPWRVADISFTRFQQGIYNFTNIKGSTQADLSILLSHLGAYSDFAIAQNVDFFDLIVGGHTHAKVDTVINDIPVVQALSNLVYLGRLDLLIKDGEIVQSTDTKIDLNAYESYDATVQAKVDAYKKEMDFSEKVGYTEEPMNSRAMGCFFTDALKTYLNTDLAIQNVGGIRSNFNAGDITNGEVFTMDPFGNQCAIFKMAVSELETFFMNSGEGYYISGAHFGTADGGLALLDDEGNVFPEADSLTLAVNDYIPAQFDSYFPYARANLIGSTTAEIIIKYLEEQDQVDYEGCDNYQSY